ncbi:MAG: hypothetical protein LW626_09915 [Verrucomicrobium sp.]|jgi:hypothetical protein|nr:hypothetical protein [Verrucomicrobium sp.]
MPLLLHVLTRPADPAVAGLIEDQRQSPDHEVVVHVLDAEGTPAYRTLLEQVFAADSVACW